MGSTGSANFSGNMYICVEATKLLNLIWYRYSTSIIVQSSRSFLRAILLEWIDGSTFVSCVFLAFIKVFYHQTEFESSLTNQRISCWPIMWLRSNPKDVKNCLVKNVQRRVHLKLGTNSSFSFNVFECVLTTHTKDSIIHATNKAILISIATCDLQSSL